MALRTPIVINAGQYQQLQSGDTLNAPQAGGDFVSQTNANVGAIVPGTPVYSAGNDSVDKAKADASATAAVMGLVGATSINASASGQICVGGILALTTGQWDTAFGTSGGLTANTKYYLSAATAGVGTSTAPTTVGQLVTPLGRAISTTELKLGIEDPTLL